MLVWRYDRFARSTQALIGGLKEFQALGVDFISYQEAVDTTTPQGEMVYGFLASVAQFESALISERVKAGMARAKAEGKRVSRPRIPQATQQEIAALHADGVPTGQIARRLGVAYGTAWNYAKRSDPSARRTDFQPTPSLNWRGYDSRASPRPNGEMLHRSAH